MARFDVVILTDRRYLKDSKDTYKHNVFLEDQLVANALSNQNLKVTRRSWDDKAFDWSSSKALLFRTTWDYFDRFDEFLSWLKNVSQSTQLINSEALIRWNIDKHYLLDLCEHGIDIPESKFIEVGSKITLKELHEFLGWTETVLKPCVSGAARHTYKLNPENLEQHEAIFQKLVEKEAMLLQPFQYNIVSEGEISLMVFNGQFTHAVLKKAKAGDFRVQDDFGGTVHNYTPTIHEIEFAENAVKGCPELPVYARVDIFKDNDYKLAVSELELIEPELWFRNHPEAAGVLAKAIKEKLYP
ncbi:ATP-grasp domain-containing protein [Winogradskyella sp. A3E31]|uniref:ATP-grasp domain-containing protein n=1 Tax=Winogradskyella sp. A3E31 TaxID=3349637 RepID=UPI00398B7D7A